jgi:aspergillopepsin I
VVPNPVKTFFTNLRASLEQPLFTIDLNYKAPGSFDFGFINASKYSGEITYLPVNSTQGFWGVTSTSYGVGDNPTMKDKRVSAIVDTGTTLMLVPKKILKAYYKQVEGAKNSNEDQGYIFPCSSVLPDLHIGFGDYTAVVPGSAINNSQVDDTHCYGGLQYSDPSQGPAGIYGDVFLKSSFVVCKHPEGEAPTIGFAAKGTNGSPTQDPASTSTAVSKHTSHKSKGKSADSVDDSKDDDTEDDDDDSDDDDDYDYKDW